MNFTRYNPANWYWIVGGDQSKFWSSAFASYVPSNDPTLLQWMAQSGQHFPTSIPNETDLYGVMVEAGLPTGSLGTVQQQAQNLLQKGSVVAVTSTGTSALNGNYSVNSANTGNWTAIQSRINAGLGLPGGGSTIPISDAVNTDHTFTAAQFTSFALAVSDYVFALIRCAEGKSSTLPAANLTIP